MQYYLNRKNQYIFIIVLLYLPLHSFAQQWDVIHKSHFDSFKNNTFISGHSLVDNPFADYLNEIAVSQDTDYNWNQQIGIGSPIRVRTSGNQSPPNNWLGYSTGKNRDTVNMNVITELANPATIGANEKYNSLLITDRHDIIDVIRWEHSASLLRHYHDRLLTGNNTAETYFYHSWLDIDPNNPQDWIDFETLMLNAWECVADKVNLTLQDNNLTAGINVIPAGWALADLLQRILDDEVPGFTGTAAQKVDALFNDNVHLNHEGIYYVAALSFAIINRRTPEGATIPAIINNSTGVALQQIAWENAQRHLTEYKPKSMGTCRQMMVDQICNRYYTFRGQPTQINACQNWMNNTGFSYNPFNWPDPDLIVWPDP